MIKRSILITGVCGFIGRHLAAYYSKLGCKVTGIDTGVAENAPMISLDTYIQVRLPDPSLEQIIRETSPDACFHCAGRASVGASFTDLQADFYASTVVTFELLNALRLQSPSCRVVFLSSAAVYGNPASLPISESDSISPISPYGFHKSLCESLCLEFFKLYGLPTAVVRIFSAYGPGLRRQVLWDMCNQAITKNALSLLGNGKESRDFIHVQDIIKGLRIVAEKAAMNGEAYNLASGVETTIKDLATEITSALDCQTQPQFSGVQSVGSPINWKADISKIGDLGFKPAIDLQTGIHSYVKWCRAEILGV